VIRKNAWTCREVHCEGEPMPETAFVIRACTPIDVREAAEMAAQRLEEKFQGDPSEWDLLHVTTRQMIEVCESDDVWRRFTVVFSFKPIYKAEEQT